MDDRQRVDPDAREPVSQIEKIRGLVPQRQPGLHQIRLPADPPVIGHFRGQHLAGVVKIIIMALDDVQSQPLVPADAGQPDTAQAVQRQIHQIDVAVEFGVFRVAIPGRRQKIRLGIVRGLPVRLAAVAEIQADLIQGDEIGIVLVLHPALAVDHLIHPYLRIVFKTLPIILQALSGVIVALDPDALDDFSQVFYPHIVFLFPALVYGDKGGDDGQTALA